MHIGQARQRPGRYIAYSLSLKRSFVKKIFDSVAGKFKRYVEKKKRVKIKKSFPLYRCMIDWDDRLNISNGSNKEGYSMEDYYALLNITKRASQDEIKNAYRAKVKQYHPDLYNTESVVKQVEAEKMTKMINNAYEILSDTIKKMNMIMPIIISRIRKDKKLEKVVLQLKEIVVISIMTKSKKLQMGFILQKKMETSIRIILNRRKKIKKIVLKMI